MTESNRARAHILVVDDNQAVRDSTADILRSAGYSVASSADAEDALGQLEAGNVSFLILDLGLGAQRGREPSHKGLDFLDRVAELPPIILVSGSGVPPTAHPRVVRSSRSLSSRGSALARSSACSERYTRPTGHRPVGGTPKEEIGPEPHYYFSYYNSEDSGGRTVTSWTDSPGKTP